MEGAPHVHVVPLIIGSSLAFLTVALADASAAPASCDADAAPPAPEKRTTLGALARIFAGKGSYADERLLHDRWPAAINFVKFLQHETPPDPQSFSQSPPPLLPEEAAAAASGLVHEDVGWRTEAWKMPVPPSVSFADEPKRRRVREAFAHAWRGYRTHAWGADELDPTTQVGHHSYGMGLTLVDSLDTMLLMNMDAEVEEAIDWIGSSLHFGDQEDINLFEVTIRVLGGLLSAYEATEHPTLLAKADELGRALFYAFLTPHGLPYGTLNLKTGGRYNPTWSRGASTIAEVATLQLEFRALARHTGRSAYEAVSQRIMDHLRTMYPQGWPQNLPQGLYPMFINVESGELVGDEITLGARADSLYEYLLKQWLLSGRTDDRMRRMYEDSVKAIRTHLVRHGGHDKCNNCTYVAVYNYKTRKHRDQMDHLACFVPGMLALGAHGETYDDDLQLAKELMHTCYSMYADMPTGLAPEIAEFHPQANKLPGRQRITASRGAKHSLLRPETVESLLIMWRVTGDAIYREMGWKIFQAFEQHAHVSGGGYSPIKDVTIEPRLGLKLEGNMESFFTAETLKYLYLLFGDGTQVPLDEYVFNTEAHPLRIHPEYAWGARWGSLPGVADLDFMRAQQRANATAASSAEAQQQPQQEAEHSRMRAAAEARASLLRALPTSVGGKTGLAK